MNRRRRRQVWTAGIVAAVVALAAVAWAFRVPLLEVIPTPPVVITEKDQGRQIDLLVGQRLEVRLPTNSNSPSLWQVGIPLSFLPQSSTGSFTASRGADGTVGYQSTIFTATHTGFGPLFMGYVPSNDQNSYQPTKSFSVIVSVK